MNVETTGLSTKPSLDLQPEGRRLALERMLWSNVNHPHLPTRAHAFLMLYDLYEDNQSVLRILDVLGTDVEDAIARALVPWAKR